MDYLRYYLFFLCYFKNEEHDYYRQNEKEKLNDYAQIRYYPKNGKVKLKEYCTK